jgi:AcrR family transcriptional regulator
VFGEKGYRDATNAEICRTAEANSAAINYHFGSKSRLYEATWEFLTEEVDRLCPLEGGVPSDASPEERLRGVIHAHLQRAVDDRLHHFHAILMVELFYPTGIVDALLARRIERNRKLLHGIVAQLLGEGCTEEDLVLCEMSVITQCHVTHRRRFSTAREDGRPVRRPPWHITMDGLDRQVDHITRFCLGGIRAVREGIQSRRMQSE